MLIWAAGRIIPEESLVVPASDRVFEHGLGLFETLRTCRGSAPLLSRHLARMTRSAAELGLPLDPAALPHAAAVAALLQAHGAGVDVMLRITMTGGVAGSASASVWMRPAPLPATTRAPGAVLAYAPWPLAPGDPLARHKTLNYWARRLAFEQARVEGTDEALFATPDARFWEGSRTNLFLVRDGVLITPGLNGPVLPGIMRALVLELAAGLGLDAMLAETGVTTTDLESADEVFLTNAVRGVVPVARLSGRAFPAPGACTSRLRERVEQWMIEEGERPS